MVLNRLVITHGDTIRFHLNHTENEEEYQLCDGEKYFFAVAREDESHSMLFYTYNQSADFDMALSLDEGFYVFELGIIDAQGNSRVILPAVDERHRAINQLIVLRRICDV